MPGQAPTEERLHLDAQGRLTQSDGAGNGHRQIEDVSDADRQYLERMEYEYAKREGGA